jgi:competence ComEA-like helix-hairpin-helix protein
MQSLEVDVAATELLSILVFANYKYPAPTGPPRMIPLMLIPARTDLRRTGLLVISVTLIFSGFACAKRSRSVVAVAPLASAQNTPSLSKRININTASAKQLEALPGIGRGLAERIIEHRQKYGPFAKPEHLILVRGISEHRFQAISDQITVE